MGERKLISCLFIVRFRQIKYRCIAPRLGSEQGVAGRMWEGAEGGHYDKLRKRRSDQWDTTDGVGTQNATKSWFCTHPIPYLYPPHLWCTHPILGCTHPIPSCTHPIPVHTFWDGVGTKWGIILVPTPSVVSHCFVVDYNYDSTWEKDVCFSDSLPRLCFSIGSLRN